MSRRIRARPATTGTRPSAVSAAIRTRRRCSTILSVALAGSTGDDERGDACPICHSRSEQRPLRQCCRLERCRQCRSVSVKAATKMVFMRGGTPWTGGCGAGVATHSVFAVWPYHPPCGCRFGIQFLLAPGLSPHPFPVHPGAGDAANVRRVAAILASPLGHREEWIRDAMTGNRRP